MQTKAMRSNCEIGGMTEKEPNGNTCPVKNQLGLGWNSQRLLFGGKFLEVNVVCETREAAEVNRVPADDHKLDAVPDKSL